MSKRTKPALVADLFCGAGGSSSGARRALAARGIEMQLCAVNHWPVAIETHQRNHPDARHYCQDVDSAKPEQIVPEGYLDLLMASPECTHHSRARGGRPIHDQGRMSAWQILRWTEALYVRRVLIENVPEFVEWGPIGSNGRPLQSKRGETFRAFVGALQAQGYRVEWRIINAADYGDATTRSRLFIMARRDGRKIQWPAPTHSKTGGVDLFGNRTEKWRAAREIIDWSIPGRSIFDRKKPLAPNTIRRIAAGLRKFGGPMAEPFLVMLYGTGTARTVDEPVPTVTANGNHIALAEPFIFANRTNNVPKSTDDPVPTIVTSGSVCLVEPESFIVNRHGENGSARVHSVEDPVPTSTTRGAGYLATPEVTPFTLGQQSGSVPREVADPLPTISTGGAISLIEPFISPFYGDKNGKPRAANDIDEPLATVTTGPRFGLVEPSIEPFVIGQQSNAAPRSTDDPVPTVATAGRISLVESFVFPVNQGNGREGGQRSVEDPLPTVVTRDTFGLVEPVLVNMKGESNGSSIDSPAPTITAQVRHLAVAEPFLCQIDQSGSGGNGVRSCNDPITTLVTKANVAVVEPFLTPYYSNGSGLHGKTVEEPLDTVTTKPRHALVEPFAIPFFGEREGQPPRTHDLSEPLPAVTSHGAGGLVEPIVATEGGRLVEINGTLYRLDIRFRMLKNPELARAMGFDDEETEYEFMGTGEQVTKQIGNAVPVNTAAALVGALMER